MKYQTAGILFVSFRLPRDEAKAGGLFGVRRPGAAFWVLGLGCWVTENIDSLPPRISNSELAVLNLHKIQHPKPNTQYPESSAEARTPKKIPNLCLYLAAVFRLQAE
jgi:hypothetical protein